MTQITAISGSAQARQEALANVLATFDRCIAECEAKLTALTGKEVVYAFTTGLAIRFPDEVRGRGEGLRSPVVVGAWNATPVNARSSALCITNGAGERAQLTNWRALLEREIVRSREGRVMVAGLI